MTKITRMSLHGFKSFAQKTEIPFDGGFNCILGPNGSGKSNVGDALCFVLGRLSAKSMRAEKAANLVFNGGKNKQPAKAATVEIAFDNTKKTFPIEAAEVQLSRTLTSKGNSIYRINGKKYTRTEVLDLMAHAKINPDGYNIILQGDITRFVDMSSVERRQIIEEISDVSIYEEKKHKSLLELEKVEEQLKNADLILKERRVHLNELKKDRDQALKYKEAKETIDSRKATVIHLQIQDKEKAKVKMDQQIASFQEKITVKEQEISKAKEQVVAFQQQMKDLNKEISQKGEKEQVQLHQELEDLKIHLAEDRTRTSTLKDELNKIQLRKDQLHQELRELEGKTTSSGKQQEDAQQQKLRKEKELAELQDKIKQFKKKHNIESSQDIEKEIEEKDKLIDQRQEQVQQLRQKQQDLFREKDKLEFQLQSMRERIKKVQEVRKEHQSQVQHLEQRKQTFKQATLQLNQSLDQDSSFASQIAHAKQKAQALQERYAQLHVKSAAYHDIGNEAFQKVKGKKGVYGTIASLGQVPQKYALALERTAGAKLQNIVVDNDQTAAECIKLLKEQRAGSGSFIPLNKIKSGSGEYTPEDKKILKEKGVHDFALSLVSFKPQFAKAFSFVFGNTLVVDDIEIARKIGIGRIRMAALDGSLAESSGVMRGGFIAKRSGTGFQEQGAAEELGKVEKEIADIENVIAATRERREGNEKAIAELRKQRAELEGEIIQLEKSLHLNTEDLDASDKLFQQQEQRLADVNKDSVEMQKNLTEINKDLVSLKSKKQMLRSEIIQLRDPRLLAQLQAFEEAQRSCRDDVLRLEQELKHRSAQVETLLAPEREKMLNIMKQHDKEEAQFKVELQRLQQRSKEAECVVVEKEQKSKQFQTTYRNLFEQRETISKAIMEAENSMEKAREFSRSQERELNLLSLQNAEVKARLSSLQDQFQQFKSIIILEGKTAAQLEQEIVKAEVLLSQMSAVNLKALEVYEQIEQEYGKLVEKKAGLEAEKTDVLTLMNEIETKKKDHFMKTFVTANDNFQRIFSTLFTKGKAYLELNNPEKPFEDGLSVKVKLTGTRFMDIKSLSGGEKTLTALSFIFALQEHQPASFYILDEIDAALDKHNSETLSKLIGAYAKNAQYIMISHNDSVISEADTLFGVSMQEGVSKVTSLRI